MKPSKQVRVGRIATRCQNDIMTKELSSICRFRTRDGTLLGQEPGYFRARKKIDQARGDMCLDHGLKDFEDGYPFLLAPVGARQAVGFVAVDDTRHIRFHLKTMLHQPIDKWPLKLDR